MKTFSNSHSVFLSDPGQTPTIRNNVGKRAAFIRDCLPVDLSLEYLFTGSFPAPDYTAYYRY